MSTGDDQKPRPATAKFAARLDDIGLDAQASTAPPRDAIATFYGRLESVVFDAAATSASPPDATVTANLVLDSVTLDTRVFQTYSFAPEWFEDALAEVHRQPSPGPKYRRARGREIIFAVCCVESYLMEWVRDQVLEGQIERLVKYFPDDDQRRVKVRWTEVMKALYEDGLIPNRHDFGGPHGDEWMRLFTFRNGLVHANASRADQPIPSLGDLDATQPGWAIRVVIERIKRMHKASGTATPRWLAEP